MKKKNLIIGLIAILCMQSYWLGSQDLTYVKQFGGTGDNTVFKSTIDQNNNVYLIGEFSGTITAGTSYTAYGTGLDIYVAKYDADGNLVWFKQIGSNNQSDYASALTLSSDGSVLYVAGGFFGSPCDFGDGYSLTNYSSGTADAYLVAINTSTGVTTNAKRIAYGAGSQRPQAIKIDKNSNFILNGFVTGNSNKTFFSVNDSMTCSGVQNYFLLQLNSSLNVNWFKQIIGNDANNKIYTLDVDNSGYYFAGTNKNTLQFDIKTLNSQSSTSDMFLYKTDFTGNGLWIRSIKGSGEDISVYATTDKAGYVYISGYYASSDLKVDSTSSLQSVKSITNRGSNDIFFAKYDTTGTLVWHDNAGSAGDDRLTRLATNGQYIVIAGQYSGNMTFGNINVTLPTGNGTDAFGVVHDANDNPLYAVTSGGSLTDLAQTCVIDNVGRYIFIGQFYSGTMNFGGGNTLTNGTTSTRDVFIAKYDKASISITATAPSCTGSSTGRLTANPEGAWYGDITYHWTKTGDAGFARDSATINSLNAGTYTVQMTDQLGYSKSKSYTLNDPAAITMAVDSLRNVSCYGGSNGKIYITPSGGTGTYTYQWTTTGGGGQSAGSQDQTTLRAGSYSVKIVDSKSCSNTFAAGTISQPAAIAITINSITPVSAKGAADGAADISVSGGTTGYTYLWTPGNYHSQDLSNVSGNTYTVTVTDGNLCTADTSLFIYEPGALNISYTKTDVNCYGLSTGAIDLTITGDYAPFTCAWTKNGDASFSSTQTDLTGLSAGTYVVTVTDSDSPSSQKSVSITILQPASGLNLTLTPTDITCYGYKNGSMDLSCGGGTSPYSFSWTKTGDASFTASSEDIEDLGPGTYTVSVTDNKGCNSEKSESVDEPGQLSITNPVVNDQSCFGGTWDGSVCVSVAGGITPYSISWTGSNSTTSCATNLRAAQYCITVTDKNNCEASNCYTVGVPDDIAIDFNNTNAKCFGSSDGESQAVVTGGTSPYTYAWSDGQTANPAIGLAEAGYTLVVTDKNKCTGSASTTISDPDSISISEGNWRNVTCNGKSDGFLQPSVTGGTGSYTYGWLPNGESVKNISALAAGSYTITVTDANNCDNDRTFVIAEPTALTLSEDLAAHVDNVCANGTAGALQVTAGGGYGDYQFNLNSTGWVDDALFTGLTAGVYPVEMRDSLYPTCLWSGSLSITIDAPEGMTFGTESVSNISCFGLSNGQVITAATGGTGSLVYTISPGDSSNSSGTFVNLPAGDYQVAVTDESSCGSVNSNTLTVTAPAAPLAFVIPADTVIGSSLDVNSYATGGTTPYAFSINPAATEDVEGIFAGLNAGQQYVITVQDANSCGSVSDTVTMMTGIISYRDGEGLRLWPNPFRTELSVEISKPEEERYEVQLLNNLGQVMKIWQVETQRGVMFRQQLEMSALPPGMYLLRVKGENSVSSARVVKN